MCEYKLSLLVLVMIVFTMAGCSSVTPNYRWMPGGMMFFDVDETTEGDFHLTATGTASQSYEEVEAGFHVRVKELCNETEYKFEKVVDSVTHNSYDSLGTGGSRSSYRIQGPVICNGYKKKQKD